MLSTLFRTGISRVTPLTYARSDWKWSKRKGQNKLRPPVKRKLTNFDNPEDMYTIKGRNIQGELARKLHNKAGVPFRRCGIEEIKSFQRILDGYQIHVVSKEHFNAIIYGGPAAEKKIYLYLHDHHYDVITAMPAFLSRNYFCTKCNKGYDHKVDHSCNNVCHQCYKTHESGDEDWIYCNDCNRYFKSAKCYEMHKQETSTGKSTCYTNFRCRKCNQSVYTKLHKTAHKCGEHYCKTCKDYVPEEHKCYMLPACSDNIDTNTKKKEGRKCKHCKQSWCGTRQHIPNLCIAHKICELCKDSKVDKTSYCDSCGKHEHIFSGESSRDDFCRWLFTEKNAGSKVLCHNFKGYDSYPILQYLYKNAILPEVIVTGSKFMSIDVPQCNIRFIDSINFLPMALDKFPKTFGLKEMVKGYFPHLFNTQENQHTDLPNLPDLKFYNPDGMTRDKRSTFMQWYGEHKYDHFNLQEELLKYCRSDVDILRKGCLEFRKMFMDITTKGDLDGIDPFESCITIASACNLVYRRNFLEHQSIGIIPANGYRCEHKQSIKALKWLKYLSEKDTIDIMHAGNGSEKQIGSFLIDRYRETEEGEREVYEFHDCFWHGCEQCFVRSTVNPETSNTIVYLFQRTMNKRSFLEKDGYKYISIWECQFDNELKSNVQMRNFVENLCLKDPLEPRDAFYGGRTEAFTTYKEAKGDKIDYYDVTSLYPFINKTGKIPLGHPKIITENFEDINRYEGLIKCKIVPPRGLFLPVLPLKCNGKLLFGLCHTCMKNNFTDECKHTEEERAIVGTWKYNPDTKEGGIFTEYVNTFLKIKQEASGWPEWCLTDQDKHTYIKNYFEKEGIWLEEKNIKENPGLRQLAKLILNNFWGKFGQRLNLPKTTYVKDAATYFDILTSDGQEVKDVSFVSEEMVRLQWINNEKFVEESGKTNVVIAAYTTAQARLQLYKYLENLGDRSLYCDTDSIIFSSKPGDWRPMTGDYLGDLTDELPNNNIEVFVSGGPKNYAFKLIKPDKAGNQTCCKIRDITLNCKNSLELNLEIVKRGG
ncbi:unnamed protein product [Mytilus edulis]|uniref:DNA-directed DNA polymerase n=1 Tax=Mytilus edulis TaxID=6550 RepID=A0A8S3RYJ2_MYTED|nr:unnamed protein product [Mytilus edulis]